MIVYITISTYVRDEIKKLSQRYSDTLEKHLDILAIDLMNEAETPLRLKRKLPPRLVYINYNLYATGHMLFKTFTNCQMY